MVSYETHAHPAIGAIPPDRWAPRLHVQGVHARPVPGATAPCERQDVGPAGLHGTRIPRHDLLRGVRQCRLAQVDATDGRAALRVNLHLWNVRPLYRVRDPRMSEVRGPN